MTLVYRLLLSSIGGGAPSKAKMSTRRAGQRTAATDTQRRLPSCQLNGGSSELGVPGGVRWTGGTSSNCTVPAKLSQLE